MKRGIATVLAAGLVFAARPAWPEAGLLSEAFSNLRSRVCVERLENNGSVNIAEAHVLFSGPAVLNGNQLVILIGGQVACVLLEPGEFTIFAYSFDILDPHNLNPKASRSKELHGRIDPAETVVLELIPGATGSAYNGSWVLRELRRLKGSVQ